MRFLLLVVEGLEHVCDLFLEFFVSVGPEGDILLFFLIFGYFTEGGSIGIPFDHAFKAIELAL